MIDLNMGNFLSLQERVHEVERHFEHKDFDLARRRFLDLAYDQDDLQLLEKAVDISKKMGTDSTPDSNSLAEAVGLLRSFQKQGDASQNRELFHWGHISKHYSNGNFHLSHIPVSVMPGAIIGVVGENGNGKTTLLRCIASQLDGGIQPEAYSYVPEGFHSSYAIKQYTGFIPQRIPRWYGKLYDNLAFSASIAGIKGGKNHIMVSYVLERFGLSKYANHTWSQISSGYRTRFEIARVVLQRPALLILDEPLANLDINAQQTLLQDLRFIAKSSLHPMGVLLSSQQLYEIEKVSDRVLFIKNGAGKYNDEVMEETGTATASSLYVMEFECKENKDAIEKALEGMFTEIRFNGGVYQVTTSIEPQKVLTQLMQNNIMPNYFRDITKSTKRFF